MRCYQPYVITLCLQRYTGGTFDSSYARTNGVDFAAKELTLENGEMVWLQLWDVGGAELYSGLSSMYYEDAVAAFVVMDVTRPTTLSSMERWKRDIDDNRGGKSSIPVLLLVNKSDLYRPNMLDLSEMDQFCRAAGFVGWFLTSAKDDKNIDEAVWTLFSCAICEDNAG